MPQPTSIPELLAVVLVEGPPTRSPLVLLHGFTGDTSTWSSLVAKLGRERTIVAVDLLGHGRSPTPQDRTAYTLEGTATACRQALREVLDGVPSLSSVPAAPEVPAAAGPLRAHWLGYSMGGRVALRMALDAPNEIASLVLVGASPGIADRAARDDRRRSDEALAAFIEREGIDAFVDRWMAHPLFATQERLGTDYLDRSRAQRLRNRPEALANTLRGMGTGAMEPLWDHLHTIDAPVLLVNGALDTKFDELGRQMQEQLPHASRFAVPDVGHAVQVEAPAALAVAVGDWCRRVDRASAGV